MKHLTDIFEGIFDDDFDVVPPIYAVYDPGWDFKFQHVEGITCPMSIMSPQFDRVFKIVPNDTFDYNIMTDEEAPPFGVKHPGTYLINWLMSQSMEIVGDNKATEQLFYKWIPKSKRIRVVWTKSAGIWHCTFYYAANTANHGMIRLNLHKK